MENSVLSILSKLQSSKKALYSVQAKMITFHFAGMLAIALLMEKFYDNLVLGSSFIWYLLLTVIINIIYAVIMRYIEQYLLANAETSVKTDLYEQSFRAIQAQEKSIIGNSKYVSELIQSIELAADLIAHYVPTLVTSIMLLALSFAVIMSVNLTFFFCYFLIFALSTSIHIWCYRKLSRKKEKIQKNTSITNSFYTEVLSGIKTIKAFQQDSSILLQGKDKAKSVEVAQRQYESTYVCHELINNLLFYISESLPILLGLYMYLLQQAGISQVIFLLQFTRYLVVYMMDISESWCNIRSSHDVLEKLRKLLTNNRVVQQDTLSLNSGMVSAPTISIQKLNISYGGIQAVKELSLDVKCGEFLIITGESGSGKSSLLNALLRYVDFSGLYFLSERNAEKIPISKFRTNFAYVSQRDDLLPVTIFENLTMGNPNIPRQKVIDILKELNLHEVIEQLPNGIQTIAGLNGVELSGGEKQRICIARALLKDAPIIVLDEPTSALDKINESIIINKLRGLTNKCVIMSSHRVECFKFSTRIVWLNKGQIAAEGTFDQLLKESIGFREYVAQIYEDSVN